jgi:hypothetical protein
MENEKSQELLTASRMEAMLMCPRRHYWRYEIGLQPDVDGKALRFGSAWHDAMEARTQGQNFEMALAIAVEGKEFDELTIATLSAMLAAYYKIYETNEIVKELHPEVKFETPISGSRVFKAAGKLDGLGVLQDDRQVLVERKTTGDSIAPDSDYWLRLRANSQLYQYVLAARAEGWNIEHVLYDVVRKPGLAPKQVPVLDENGLKIVLDDVGERCYNEKGKPRQSTAGLPDSYKLQITMETPDEFSKRLYEDIMSRPEFYFCRREVPILDCDLEEFEYNRVQVARMILDRRRQEKNMDKPDRAWPRHVNGLICPFCPYSSFCLQNISVNPSQPPAGFKVGEIHNELN